MITDREVVDIAAQCVRQGAVEQAKTLYRQALEFRPESGVLWTGLGRVCKGLASFDEAAMCFQRAATACPDDPIPLNEWGIVLMEQGEITQAVECFDRALSIRSDLVAVINNRGLALLALDRAEDARLSFEHALTFQPDLADLHNNLGLALQQQGRLDEAVGRFRIATDLRPEWPDAHNNLGTAISARGMRDEAIACYECAVRHGPNHFGALTNLGYACFDQGRIDEAVAWFRRAIASRPEHTEVHGNLLLALHFQEHDPRAILEEARSFAQIHAAPVVNATVPRRHRPIAGAKLNLGFVSGDFREHPVARFLEPMFTAISRADVQITCYSNVSQPDEITERFRALSDRWRPIIGLSDAEAVEQIRADNIDVLVDLSGHTGGNRLGVFARRPAPVQVSYLGYLGTTGLDVIDGYITDALADPPGLADEFYQEPLIHLPDCAFCYDPGNAPDVGRAPSCGTDRITFGCLNNIAKVSNEVLRLWSRILAAVPEASLVLRSGTGRGGDDRLRETLVRERVDLDRLLLVGRTASRSDYMALFHKIDIGLDPFPYNGVTTTCDALWMGVPVVSLAGLFGPSRQGVRMLKTVGLEELIASTPDDYIRIAVKLANDAGRVAQLRGGLRAMMLRSRLMDPGALARHFEAACRRLWERWASGFSPDVTQVPN